MKFAHFRSWQTVLRAHAVILFKLVINPELDKLHTNTILQYKLPLLQGLGVIIIRLDNSTGHSLSMVVPLNLGPALGNLPPRQ